MVAVETVRDGQILDISIFSDGLDVECEETQALRIKPCVLVLYCSATNYPQTYRTVR